MFEYFEAQKVIRKAFTKDEKAAIKKARDTLEAPYKMCMLDGRKETVGNFRIEPPGLFRGRGEHPKKGKLKVSLCVEYSPALALMLSPCSSASLLSRSQSTVRRIPFLPLPLVTNGNPSDTITR